MLTSPQWLTSSKSRAAAKGGVRSVVGPDGRINVWLRLEVTFHTQNTIAHGSSLFTPAVDANSVMCASSLNTF